MLALVFPGLLPQKVSYLVMCTRSGIVRILFKLVPLRCRNENRYRMGICHMLKPPHPILCPGYFVIYPVEDLRVCLVGYIAILGNHMFRKSKGTVDLRPAVP